MDKINPDYYKSGIETADYIESHSMDYFQGNVIKYVSRWRQKNGLDDLLKAKHYLEFLIERERER